MFHDCDAKLERKGQKKEDEKQGTNAQGMTASYWPSKIFDVDVHPDRFPDAEKGLQFADGEVEMENQIGRRLWEDAEKGVPKGEKHCRSASYLHAGCRH